MYLKNGFALNLILERLAKFFGTLQFRLKYNNNNNGRFAKRCARVFTLEVTLKDSRGIHNQTNNPRKRSLASDNSNMTGATLQVHKSHFDGSNRPKVAADWLTMLLRIQEVAVSYLGPHAGYCDLSIPATQVPG
jgi:hypothetical protein